MPEQMVRNLLTVPVRTGAPNEWEEKKGKVGILEMGLIFQPGNSLCDALDVRQAVVVLPVKLCHVLRGNRTEPAAKRNGESGESCP